VKRFLLATALAAAALAGILGYASNRREQTYRRLIEQGNAALAQGDNFAAVEAFTVAVALKPDSMLGYLKRGEAYRRNGELETALKDLRTASQLDPSATRPLELLGDVEHALRRYDRATARYEQYVRIDDRSPRILYKLALAKYHAGNAAGALESLRGAIKIDGRFAQAYYLMGLCLETLRKPDQARVSLHRAVDLAPSLLDAREELAELYRQTSRTEERLAELQALRTLDPDAPSRYIALGFAQAEVGQFDRAITVLSRAAELFPSYPYTYVALGRVWLDASQARRDPVALRKAVEALERGAATDASSEALMLLGKALLISAEPVRAAAALLDATTKKPVDPLAFYYLAEAAERTGDVAVARQALLDYQALEGDPTDPRGRAALFERVADLSTRVGEPGTAVLWFQRAASADPGSVNAALLVRLAEAQWHAGDIEGARESATKALEREPQHRAARALLRKFR
jgi:tetratricopeptide (TPR) repeat protein